MNEQERFWAGQFGKDYVARNREFDQRLLIQAWSKMLISVEESSLDVILECGSNIGRNLKALRDIYPEAKLCLIEINQCSYKLAVEEIKPWKSTCCSLLESNFNDNTFDFVFTCGVLIHIAPYNLYKNMEKIYAYSRKYILFCEYFSRKLEAIPYHGHNDKCFKMDFGKIFIDHFDVELMDYGFLYSYEYEDAGFDDMTWWLFKKKEIRND